ncbi:phenylalanine--tRNA ligase subunit beta [Candidatus Aerophobetes bacterium]|uniref:Phenylalanine--tRNA ligase beta subunit n=1 Tax=Aerophobetes bacterium TaxID=2030807 RepID=A0A523US33_UNCAE|nr:MAG: phenylalanine--tRNA ligase subunit beta [Candidatus Aerophobetes bacterium]
MRLSFKHLREIVNFPYSAQELAERLTNLGLEVRKIESLPRLEKVIVGKILTIQPHPQADLLNIVRVDIGGEILLLISGAANIKEGLMVPVALEGAILPGGIRVEKKQMRGVESVGMLCSEEELGLGKDRSGIMILPPQSPLGQNLSQVLELEDVILDLEVTPNRGDCLSVIGISREIAALTSSHLRVPPSSLGKAKMGSPHLMRIQIQDPDLCPYYGARLIKNVKVGPSPLWLWRYILISGGKPINNIVDITNYILWEMGQPLHAFDYSTIHERKIIVRRAKKKEILITLDGVKRELNEDMLVIADSTRAVALAGIIGGESTQVQSYTQDVLLEAAYFNPICIRQTSRRLGLATEASSRFEKGVDPLMVRKALDRAFLLIQEIAGGKMEEGLWEEGKVPWRKRKVSFRPSRARRILGTRITSPQMRKILTRLTFGVEGGRIWKVSVPSFRSDISREIDLIEEVARVYGYGRIGVELPPLGDGEPGENQEERIRGKIRQILKGLGFFEVIGVSFSGEDIFKKAHLPLKMGIRVRNPLSSGQEILSSHLFPHLLEITSYNLNQGESHLRIFELDDVFQKVPDLKEKLTLGGLILESNFDFLSLKGIAETLMEGLNIEGVEFTSCSSPYFSFKERLLIKKEGLIMARLGRISRDLADGFEVPSSIYLFEFEVNSLYSQSRPIQRFRPLPRFPALERDLSLVVKEEIPARKVKDCIIESGGEWLEEVKLFDLYRGSSIPAGYKSLAYSLTFRSPRRTLTDNEVDRVQEEIVHSLGKLGISLRQE